MLEAGTPVSFCIHTLAAKVLEVLSWVKLEVEDESHSIVQCGPYYNVSFDILQGGGSYTMTRVINAGILQKKPDKNKLNNPRFYNTQCFSGIPLALCRSGLNPRLRTRGSSSIYRKKINVDPAGYCLQLVGWNYRYETWRRDKGTEMKMSRRSHTFQYVPLDPLSSKELEQNNMF